MSSDEKRAETLARLFFSGHLSRRDLLRRSAMISGGALAATTLAPLLAACSAITPPPGSSSTAGATGSGGQTSPDSSNGSSTGATSKSNPVAGGKLTAALTGNPSSMDPAAAGIYTSLQVIDNIFSKLITMDEKGEFVPDLAKSWTKNDEVTYTFDLVENATFHNGEKFTSKDVKYTFERILNPKTASTYASNYTSIKTIEVASPSKVVFHLSTPFSPFLTNISQNGEIVNQKAIESSDPTRQPVGTGPFQFVEWVQNDHITIKKYVKYFMTGQPYLDQVIFRFLNVDKSRLESLQSGQVDWVDAVPLNELAGLKANDRYRYATSAVAGIPDFLALNCSKPPFNNKALRQAVAAAVDRKQILDIAYFGAGQQGLMEVPNGSKWFGGTPPYPNGPDLATAKQKMTEAGHPNGLTVTYLSLPQYPELAKTGVVLKDQLAKIGITVNIEQLEVTVWFDRYSKANYDMTSAYWSGTIDPDNFYSTQLVSGPNNYTRYSNKAVDSIVAEARKESDETKRKVMYEKIRNTIWEDAPLVFLHYETINYLMSSGVHGSSVNPTLELGFGHVWKSV